MGARVNLQLITDRIAQGLPFIDSHDLGGRFSQRTGKEYLRGLKTIPEREVTTKLSEWWSVAHSEDLAGGLEIVAEVPYPRSLKDRCDIVIREASTRQPVWAIEVKHIALVGDNGKNNDYGVAKMLSPYLKDRSLRHDMLRLRDSGFNCDRASVVYSFSYSPNSVKEALSRFPEYGDRIRELDRVRVSAQDESGVYSITPMVEMASHMLKSEGLTSEIAESNFSDAWSHPCGGNGIVVAWRVS